MNTANVSESYESMLHDDTLFIRPLHFGARSKRADSMYISHKAYELYRMAQRRKLTERVHGNSGRATHVRTDMAVEQTPVPHMMQRAGSLKEYPTPQTSVQTPPQAPPEKNASQKPPRRRASHMWQVPSWLAELYPMYVGANGGKGSITVQGMLYEHSAAWDAYLTAVGTHYRNTLVTYNIKGIEGHYDALIVDEAKSDAIKNDFYRRINADKKLQKIMQKLGIHLPT